MRKTTVAFLALLACSSPRLPKSAASDAVLTVRGAVKGGPYPLSRTQLDAMPRRAVRGVDPITGEESVFEGVQMATLFQRVELEKGADAVIIHTEDKRAIPVPILLIRQLRPVIADRQDGHPMADLILAWPDAEQFGLVTDPRERAWWVRGVVAFEVVDSSRTVGRALAVPPGAVDAARQGAEVYAFLCIYCHRVRTAGGEKGPELTTVTDRIARDAFDRTVRGHPIFKEKHIDPPGQEALGDLWQFLHALATAAPREEPVPDEKPPEQRPPEGPRLP
jgi:hypothetical protein